MDTRLLDLNFAQLSKAWSKSKFNNYSDVKKHKHIEQLSELYDKLKNEDFATLKVDELVQRSHIIDFFFKNLEFLENSTFNLIPFEIVECLKYALNDWLDKPESYIIVTSLVNNLMSYSFDSLLAIDIYYEIIKTTYKLEFEQRLIQINIPRFLVRDYLASVALYHELGHFIDTFYEITLRIALTMANKFNSGQISPDERADLYHFFPLLASIQSVDKYTFGTLKSHVAEYFCDIFASQYIGTSLSGYVLYITKNQSSPGPMHPASTQRLEMVNLFLASDKSSYTLRAIVEAIEDITSRKVGVKHAAFKESDLLHMLPADIDDSKQLHYLFSVGWKMWLEDSAKISSENNIKIAFSDDKVYEIINNLIEKSIGNFIVTSSWNKFS
ncbi:MAG: hypothetical protein ACRYFR_20250 [Janthinobacterium lividum]